MSDAPTGDMGTIKYYVRCSDCKGRGVRCVPTNELDETGAYIILRLVQCGKCRGKGAILVSQAPLETHCFLATPRTPPDHLVANCA